MHNADCILTVVLMIITALTVRWYMQRQQEKDEEKSSNDASAVEKAQTYNVNRDLPPIPPSDSASEITARPSTVDPSSSAAPLLVGTGANRRPSGSHELRLDENAARSHSMRSSYIPTYVDVPAHLPNPFGSDDGHGFQTQTRAQARAQTLPNIQTQTIPENHQRNSSDDPYGVGSFMASPTTSSPQIQRSLTFSESLTATANGTQQRLPDPPPSPSQWLSRSPGPSRRTSTLLEDMVVYQKGLEAESEKAGNKGASGSSPREPPPRYSVEEPRTSNSHRGDVSQ